MVRKAEFPMQCEMAQDCAEHHALVTSMADKVDSMHDTFNHVRANTDYLRDMAVSIGLIQEHMYEIKSKLINHATSDTRIPVDSLKAMMKEQARSSQVVYRVMGTMILALIVTLSYVLVGEKLGWIEKLPF